jgi:hypothetical protein
MLYLPAWPFHVLIPSLPKSFLLRLFGHSITVFEFSQLYSFRYSIFKLPNNLNDYLSAWEYICQPSHEPFLYMLDRMFFRCMVPYIRLSWQVSNINLVHNSSIFLKVLSMYYWLSTAWCFFLTHPGVCWVLWILEAITHGLVSDDFARANTTRIRCPRWIKT